MELNYDTDVTLHEKYISCINNLIGDAKKYMRENRFSEALEVLNFARPKLKEVFLNCFDSLDFLKSREYMENAYAEALLGKIGAQYIGKLKLTDNDDPFGVLFYSGRGPIEKINESMEKFNEFVKTNIDIAVDNKKNYGSKGFQARPQDIQG